MLQPCIDGTNPSQGNDSGPEVSGHAIPQEKSFYDFTVAVFLCPSSALSLLMVGVLYFI